MKSSAGDITWIDKDTVRVAFPAVPPSGVYDFSIDGFTNPFSLFSGTKLLVKHWPGCTGFVADTNTKCTKMESDNLSIENTACEFILPDIETLNVNTLDDNKITATVQPLVDGDPNFVGSEDGFITLSFKPGKGFSKWGGAIIFRAPNWFSANVDSNDNSNGS